MAHRIRRARLESRHCYTVCWPRTCSRHSMVAASCNNSPWRPPLVIGGLPRGVEQRPHVLLPVPADVQHQQPCKTQRERERCLYRSMDVIGLTACLPSALIPSFIPSFVPLRPRPYLELTISFPPRLRFLSKHTRVAVARSLSAFLKLPLLLLPLFAVALFR